MEITFNSFFFRFQQQIKIVEDETKDEIEEEPLPPMRHDIFGLNHSEMMARVS